MGEVTAKRGLGNGKIEVVKRLKGRGEVAGVVGEG